MLRNKKDNGAMSLRTAVRVLYVVHVFMKRELQDTLEIHMELMARDAKWNHTRHGEEDKSFALVLRGEDKIAVRGEKFYSVRVLLQNDILVRHIDDDCPPHAIKAEEEERRYNLRSNKDRLKQAPKRKRVSDKAKQKHKPVNNNAHANVVITAGNEYRDLRPYTGGLHLPLNFNHNARFQFEPPPPPPPASFPPSFFFPNMPYIDTRPPLPTAEETLRAQKEMFSRAWQSPPNGNSGLLDSLALASNMQDEHLF